MFFSLLKKLNSCSLLSEAGREGSSFGGEIFYNTALANNFHQIDDELYLCEVFGAEYIWRYFKDFVCQIVAIDKNGDETCGTGVLIDSYHILTCAHVISDVAELPKTIQFQSQSFEVAESKFSGRADVGIIKLSDNNPLPRSHLATWANPNILEPIVVMGYPKIPLASKAYPVVMNGEVNSFIKTFQQEELFLFSSIARPGNSGGPVINRRGQIVGLVSKDLFLKGRESESTFQPFSAAVPFSIILKESLELFPESKFKLK